MLVRQLHNYWRLSGDLCLGSVLGYEAGEHVEDLQMIELEAKPLEAEPMLLLMLMTIPLLLPKR